MDSNYQQGMYYPPDMMAYGGYGQFGVPDPGSAMMLAQQAMDYHALQHYNYTQLAAYHDPNLAMMGMDDGSGMYGQQQQGNYPALPKNFLQVKNVEDATAQQMQDFFLELLGTTDTSIITGFYKHEQSWYANFQDEGLAHFAMQTIRTHYVGKEKLFVKLFNYRQLPKPVQRQASHGRQGGGNQKNQQHQHSSSHQNQSQQGGGQQASQQGYGHGGGQGYGHEHTQHTSSHHGHHGGHHAHSGGGHQNQHQHGGHGHHHHGGPRGPRGNQAQQAASAAAAAAAQPAAAQQAQVPTGQAAVAAVAVTPDESAGIWNRTGTSGGGSPPKFRRTQPRGPAPPPSSNPLSPLSGSTTTDTEAVTEQNTPLSTSEAAWEATEKGKYKDAAKFSALLPVVQVPGPTTEMKAFAVGRGKPIAAAAEGRITPPGVSVVPLAR